MINFPIELHVAQLRPKEFSLRRVAEELVENMVAWVQDGIMDATTDPDPSEAVGRAPKFDGGSWYSWEPANNKYAPIEVWVKNVEFQASPTSDKRQIFQNKNGIVALQDDAYGIRDTVILPEGLVSVDWDMGSDFLCILSGNRQSAFYMSHSKPGMEIVLLLVNNGTNQIVSQWDPIIHWPAATAPVIPAANPGTSTRQFVDLRNVNGTIYGEFINYTDIDPIAYSASQPLFLS